MSTSGARGEGGGRGGPTGPLQLSSGHHAIRNDKCNLLFESARTEEKTNSIIKMTKTKQNLVSFVVYLLSVMM